MFGFLRGDRNDLAYRQVYAGCCSFQQREFGIASLAFLSYEATFLYLLAVDAGAVPSPSEEHVTCCRLRRGGTDIYAVDSACARFCSAFALLLASVKLDDDIADDRSLVARLARWKLGGKIASAIDHLETLRPGLRAEVDRHLAAHAEMERTAEPVPMAVYVKPTAAAFGDLFELFQSQLRLSGQVSDIRSIGESIGAAIIAFDAAIDWRRDRQRGRYNPLASQAEVQEAYAACQRHLSQAGWHCREQFGDASHAARTVSHVFKRVSQRLDHVCKPQSRKSLFTGWTRRSKQLRAAFCDCCDCPIGDVPCCDVDGTWCGDACCFCDCCIAPCDTGKKKDGEGKYRNVVGKTGVAAGTLDPEGVVMIKGERYPAKSIDGTIEDLVSVEVVDQNDFGVTVKRANLGMKKHGL